MTWRRWRGDEAWLADLVADLGRVNWKRVVWIGFVFYVVYTGGW